MKKANHITKGAKRKIALALYYTQLALLSPILLPLIVVLGVFEFFLEAWSSYKEWYISKFLDR